MIMLMMSMMTMMTMNVRIMMMMMMMMMMMRHQEVAEAVKKDYGKAHGLRTGDWGFGTNFRALRVECSYRARELSGLKFKHVQLCSSL